MSLLKTEIVCQVCEVQYVLVLKDIDLKDLSCCPFCSAPLDIETTDKDENSDV